MIAGLGVICRRLLVCLAVACGGFGQQVAAREPWTDPELPEVAGLQLWLDARSQPRAWTHYEVKSGPLVAQWPFDAWFDGSSKGRHFTQRARAGQPRFQQGDDCAWVQFDGKDDCLSLREGGFQLLQGKLFLLIAPRSNPGGYSAILGAGAVGRNDYQSGFNIDQSHLSSSVFQFLNIEGVGFGGAVSHLLDQPRPFEEFQLIEVAFNTEGVEVRANGGEPRRRSRAAQSLWLEEITLGARHYSNEDSPPYLTGFLDGDISELLLYDRLLSEEQSDHLRRYLMEKRQRLNQTRRDSTQANAHFLTPVDDPPEVQVLAPGFAVRPLPVRLGNINNVLYRDDGKLVALGYDGNIYLLSDSDGDGLEDQVHAFWENQGRLRSPVGMALTPPGYAPGRGVLVASKGKCSLIVDTDGDDRADQEKAIADGWTEIPHGVDALGVAVDPGDGSVYFGLSTQDFTNAFLVDGQGKSHYDVRSERGTIMRISPDFSSREIVATGIRFPVALRFNALRDLFCTDQEGATWLANGNPLDELLHIKSGRHYGFPPRHPRFLPNVIDEPSDFDYGPQHQSTCGLNFNEPVAGGPVFGPSAWRGSALICGYSRGKIFRTQLAKTPHGYVGRNQVLACLQMLTADACVSPSGHLVVATHGGGPDWGSGPTGEGRLFQIAYRSEGQPQPVVTWPVSPRQINVAFDRPLDPQTARRLAATAELELGRWARAGDQFETLRPGYAVVSRQMASPRRFLSVRSAQISPDRRTLMLLTDPHQAVDQHVRLTLKTDAGPEASTLDVASPQDLATKSNGSPAEIPQADQIDLDCNLNGLTAQWIDLQGTQHDPIWLPHLDPSVSREFTLGSSLHDSFWAELNRGGTLRFTSQLRLDGMLRPAVQPGSVLSDPLPEEIVHVRLQSNAAMRVEAPWASQRMGRESDMHVVDLDVESPGQRLLPLVVELQVDASSDSIPTLEISWTTSEDSRRRALPLHRQWTPWARDLVDDAGDPSHPEHAPASKDDPLLAGGSWSRGRRIFYDSQSQCGQCHRLAGRGGDAGPDLSNLVHRDAASVLRDIQSPSFSINPDYLSYQVQMTDGRVLSGVVRDRDQQLQLLDSQARAVALEPSDVEQMTPSSVSLMPEGLAEKLGPEATRDLLTFLLTPPPSMPRDRPGRPLARTRGEVAEAMADQNQSMEATNRQVRIVLAGGPKDHGPGEHDYPAWLEAWSQLLGSADHVEVEMANPWPTPAQWSRADGVVIYQRGTWSQQRAADLDAFLKRGGGASLIHFAVDGGDDPAGMAERIGLAWQGGASRFRHGELTLEFNSPHQITRHLKPLTIVDESYWNLRGDASRVEVLAEGLEDSAAQPLLWAREHDRGRVFVSIPGHYSWTFDDPLFRLILLRGIAWTMREPTSRFEDLVTLGADLRP